ncbi:alpha amylase family protein [Marinilabiliaceae bacterium ANBcel2]|nr:alpha amylase family protein [Marinilabiliaceae bacterium ANBcel2]
MKIKFLIIILFVAFLSACSDSDNDIVDDNKDNGSDEPPVEEEDPRVFLWVDASANYSNLSTEDGIESYVEKANDIGVTHLVIDVKGTSGEVLYDSDIATMNLEWDGAQRSRDFDYLQLFIDKAKEFDIEVFAAMNVFSGGNRSYQRGTVYEDEDRYHWASTTYTKQGELLLSPEAPDQGGIMLNVSLEEVREYQLAVMEEIATKYPELTGITLDRCRWDGGFRGDFSEKSRQLFEEFLGQNVHNYPQDILDWNYSNGQYERVDGPLFQQWNEWRCSVVYNFIENAKDRLATVAPEMEFTAYVGAWYGQYYEYGVNWASNRYSPYDNASYRSWATTSYHQWGYAQLLDLLMTGNYAYSVSLEESQGWSVESMAIRANEVTRGDTDVYASLYLFDYIVDREMDVNQMERAIEMCFKRSEGVMLFDVIYLEQYDCWENAKNGIDRGLAASQ